MPPALLKNIREKRTRPQDLHDIIRRIGRDSCHDASASTAERYEGLFTASVGRAEKSKTSSSIFSSDDLVDTAGTWTHVDCCKRLYFGLL